MTIRVGQVEEPLAPFGVTRRRVWTVPGGDQARMEGVNVRMVEDNTSCRCSNLHKAEKGW